MIKPSLVNFYEPVLLIIQTDRKCMVDSKRRVFIENTYLLIFICFPVYNKHQNVNQSSAFVYIWEHQYFHSKSYYITFYRRHHWGSPICYPLGPGRPVYDRMLTHDGWKQPGHCRSGAIPVPSNSNQSVRGRPGLLWLLLCVLWLEHGGSIDSTDSATRLFYLHGEDSLWGH